MANNLTVTYKGNTIHTASASGSATLETGGTWCEDDIGLSYSFEGYELEVTVTNGTATSVTASLSGVTVSLDYDSTSGKWKGQLIPGTWAVTITDGTHTNSATVTVTQAGLYELTIYMPDVPSAYTQLEYLESSGTQCINTGVAASQNTSVEMKISGFTQNGSYTVAGYDKKWLVNSVTIGRYCGFGTTYLDGGSLIDGLVHIVNLSESGLFVDGVQKGGTPSPSSFSGGNIYLFCLNRNETRQEFSAVKIHYCKISSNRYFYPARRNSDSVLGMYDTANNVFYTNAGTGTFIAGPAV